MVKNNDVRIPAKEITLKITPIFLEFRWYTIFSWYIKVISYSGLIAKLISGAIKIIVNSVEFCLTTDIPSLKSENKLVDFLGISFSSIVAGIFINTAKHEQLKNKIDNRKSNWFILSIANRTPAMKGTMISTESPSKDIKELATPKSLPLNKEGTIVLLEIEKKISKTSIKMTII